MEYADILLHGYLVVELLQLLVVVVVQAHLLLEGLVRHRHVAARLTQCRVVSAGSH